MAGVKEYSGADLNTISRFNGVSNVLGKINGVSVDASSLLLDTYTGAAAAYSVRRLNSAYTGACMRIREDGTNTETDIGFDANGDLDTAAIASHCGSNNGFVRTWYGQESSGGTGSGVDAVQTAAKDQPQIYNGTSVFTENGKPIIKNQTGGSANRNAFSKSIATFTTDNWAFGVCLVDQTFGGWIEGPTGNDYLGIAQSGSSSSAFGGVTGVSLFKDGASWTAPTRDDWYTDLLNNQSLIVANWSSSSWTSFAIGYLTSANVYINPMQEFVLWTSDQSSNRSGIETNQNGYFSIYC